MKRAIGVAAFVLFFAIPAHAQKGAAAGSSSVQLTSGGGGGGFGASGTVLLPSYPRAHFSSRAVSGSDDTFVPSAYLPFDRAVAQGQAILDAEKKTPAEAAAAGSIVPKAHAKVALVQDVDGDPIVIKQ